MDGVSHCQVHSKNAVVVAVIEYDSLVDVDLFWEKFKKAILHGNFTKTIVTQNYGFASLCTPYNWDSKSNLTVSTVNLDKEESHNIISSFASAKLDFSKPAWAVLLIRNLCLSKSTMVLKYHHCYADGFTILRHFIKKPEFDSVCIKPKVSLLKAAIEFVVGLILFLSYFLPDRSLFRKKSESSKISFHSHKLDLSLANLKSRKPPNRSVNDLFMTALSATLPSDLLAVVWTSPVNQRIKEWGNDALGCGFVRLSGDHMDKVHEKMRFVKLQGPGANLCLRLVGWFPGILGKYLWQVLADKPSISVSNLAGPKNRVSWPDDVAVCEDLYFFVPPQFHVGLFVCFLTYADKIRITLCSKEGVVSRGILESYCRKFEETLASLL
jgi:WS/DGAT C-terminal domain/Wax ester synthase-like Acyl-CoA acyltransferase domain